jgi:hypothetical protein
VVGGSEGFSGRRASFREMGFDPGRALFPGISRGGATFDNAYIGSPDYDAIRERQKYSQFHETGMGFKRENKLPNWFEGVRKRTGKERSDIMSEINAKYGYKGPEGPTRNMAKEMLLKESLLKDQFEGINLGGRHRNLDLAKVNIAEGSDNLSLDQFKGMDKEQKEKVEVIVKVEQDGKLQVALRRNKELAKALDGAAN